MAKYRPGLTRPGYNRQTGGLNPRFCPVPAHYGGGRQSRGREDGCAGPGRARDSVPMHRRTALPRGGQDAGGVSVTILSIHLDGASVEAIARRVVELTSSEQGGEEWIDAAQVARRFSLSRDYVYEHADELGAVRLGDGPRARLRFDVQAVRGWLVKDAVRVRDESRRGKRPRVRCRGSVELLPVKNDHK